MPLPHLQWWHLIDFQAEWSWQSLPAQFLTLDRKQASGILPAKRRAQNIQGASGLEAPRGCYAWMSLRAFRDKHFSLESGAFFLMCCFMLLVPPQLVNDFLTYSSLFSSLFAEEANIWGLQDLEACRLSLETRKRPKWKTEMPNWALWHMFVKGEEEGMLRTRKAKRGLLVMPPTIFDNTFICQDKCYRKTCSKCNGFDKLG